MRKQLDDVTIQEHVIRALGLWGGEEGLGSISALIQQTGNGKIGTACVEALSNIGGCAATKSLLPLLSRDCQLFRNALNAIETLACSGPVALISVTAGDSTDEALRTVAALKNTLDGLRQIDSPERGLLERVYHSVHRYFGEEQ